MTKKNRWSSLFISWETTIVNVLKLGRDVSEWISLSIRQVVTIKITKKMSPVNIMLINLNFPEMWHAELSFMLHLLC